ncbi:MAG: fibronectin type III domain-containing protein, partial [Gammaproteobacteria bacterium]
VADSAAYQSAHTADTAYTIPGLTAGATYEVQVRTISQAGSSAYAPKPPVTAVPTGLPGAPQNIRVTAADGKLHVAWQAPAGGAAEYAYRLRWGQYETTQLLYRGAQARPAWDAHTPVTPRGEAATGALTYTITGLTNGGAYQVEVAAVTDAGAGEYVKGPDGYPLAPLAKPGVLQNVQASATLDTLNVAWDAPAAAESVRSYHLLWRPASESQPKNIVHVNADDIVSATAPAYTISGLDPSTIYFVRVAAENSAGTGAFSPEASATTASETKLPEPPGPPQQVDVTAADGALNVAWKAPAEAKPGYTYQVHWKPIDGDIAPATATTGTLSYSITGLTNGAAYVVKVAAINAGGIGAYSEEKTGTPLAPLAKPGVLQNVQATATLNTLSVAWDAPADSEAVRSYHLLWRPASEPQPKNIVHVNADDIVSATAPAYIITGLDPATTYFVRVAAENDAGVGAFSPEASATTNLPEPPGPPQQVDVTAADGALHVGWKAPAEAKPGYTYQVHWKPIDGDIAPATATTGTLSYRITGLTNFAAYVVKVAASNAGGIGAYSEEKIGTPFGRPGAPQNVKVTPEIFTLNVKWDAPAAAEAVRSYHLLWRTDQEPSPRNIAHVDAADIDAVIRATMPAYTITGLQENRPYFVRIAAENAAGVGAFSPEAQATTKHLVFNLDVNEDGVENGHDGILISRYLLGVRGDALVHGQTNNSAETIEKIIEAGLKNGKLKVVTGEGEKPQWLDGIEVAKFLLGIKNQNQKVTEKIQALSAE